MEENEYEVKINQEIQEEIQENYIMRKTDQQYMKWLLYVWTATEKTG